MRIFRMGGVDRRNGSVESLIFIEHSPIVGANLVFAPTLIGPFSL